MDYLRLLRPHQWVKNLLVLFPALTSVASSSAIPWGSILLCFAAFCLASSAVYVVNDIFDADRDRSHPSKRERPIAKGAVSVTEGWAIAGVLGGLALIGAYQASRPSLGFVFAYMALNLAYCVWTKHIPLLDCGSIALGFSLRFLAGAAGFGLAANPILLSSCFFGAFSMALMKRRIELSLLAPGEKVRRPSLLGLNLPVLDLLVGIFSSTAITLYSGWTISVGKPLAVFSLPFLVILVSRVIWLAYLNKKGEDFAKTLLTDPFCLAFALLFVFTVGVSLSA